MSGQEVRDRSDVEKSRHVRSETGLTLDERNQEQVRRVEITTSDLPSITLRSLSFLGTGQMLEGQGARDRSKID
jgi:hypothetical protein